MNTPTPADNPVQNARALQKTLQENFVAFRDYLPLAIGIDKQILERLPQTDRKLLRIALGMHTHSLRYLKAMEKATHRYDLDGKPGEEVNATHREYASETLRERFKKEAERRRAEDEQRRVQREAEAAERQRSAKLNQLVAKFGKAR